MAPPSVNAAQRSIPVAPLIEGLKAEEQSGQATGAPAGAGPAPAASHVRCVTPTPATAESDTNSQPQYKYPTLFPLFGPGCTDAAILNFFSVGGVTETANNVQYLYNAQQSASQISADLLTVTFAPGFQAVLSGTATAGSGQPINSSSGGASGGTAGGSSASNTTTDSVATAVAKIENGGDFNVRFPTPVLYHLFQHGSVEGLVSPNVGFNINGFSGQSTITEATEYSVNVPFEIYAQTKSIDPTSDGIASATLFLDLKPAAEVISSDLAQKIQLTGDRGFFLGQASVGIEFSNSIRLSFQYIYGPNQIYQGTSSAGASTPATSRIGGFHLAVSFSPQKSNSSGQ
ncbi:MAG: hypothetical protein ABSD59_24575 [Terracidiphilus sp.]